MYHTYIHFTLPAVQIEGQKLQIGRTSKNSMKIRQASKKLIVGWPKANPSKFIVDSNDRDLHYYSSQQQLRNNYVLNHMLKKLKKSIVLPYNYYHVTVSSIKQ